ncbi:MAG: aminotransferase class V-fold PLP-dependent enzyme [Geobacteraceae bacterium]|nr:aminotransferase class V-fold PLP-dependent enzyme [Geobacteraceae bacterium]
MSIYLDNAATTFPKPENVYIEMDRVIRTVGVSPSRGGYRQSLDASRILFETRESLATLLGVADSSRLIITHSATESLNLAVKGFLKPGDHVVTTTMEHNSLARPLHEMSHAGVDLTWASGDSDGYVSVDAILKALTPATRLVAMTHCSNVTGAINPAEEIGAVLKERGITFLLDASQSAGSIPLDIDKMNVDILAAPGHKGIYGPQGTGFLYIVEGLELKPLIVGGTGGGSTEITQPLELPERFESGTHNIAGIAGLKAGADFLISTGVSAIHDLEINLVNRLIEGLLSINGIKVINSDIAKLRGSVVSFTLNGVDSSVIGYTLDRDFDISVRVGLHCAPLAHRTIGTFPEGTVRVSPGAFNTEDQIDCFIAAMKQIAAP